LDKITITIDNKDIERINCSGYEHKDILKKEYIHWLERDSINIVNQIKLADKKIIAIGETIHGSNEINEKAFQIIKSCILKNNCKLVLLEMGLPESLKCNLYIQGKLPEDAINEIKEEINKDLIQSSTFVDFLIWLRNYNKKVSDNVILLGLIDIHDPLSNPLFDYMNAFYSSQYKEIFLPLLNNLHYSRFKETLTLMTSMNNELKEIMGNIEYEIFIYTLNRLIHTNERNISVISTYKSILLNDYYMWINAEKFIKDYISSDEKVLIYAHYNHVKKKNIPVANLYTYKNLGQYLSDNFNSSFSAIAITVGEGEISIRGNSTQDFVITRLHPPMYGSIEHLFLKMSNIYYPTHALENNVYLIRDLGNRRTLRHNEWEFSPLKDCADGIIFLRKSNSFKGNNYPYMEDYFWNKGIKRVALLKKIHETS
jgi:erythromycin esterase-like protein